MEIQKYKILGEEAGKKHLNKTSTVKQSKLGGFGFPNSTNKLTQAPILKKEDIRQNTSEIYTIDKKDYKISGINFNVKNNRFEARISDVSKEDSTFVFNSN